MNRIAGREVIVLDVPVPANVELLCPENVLLKFGTKTIDVGALCYSKRSFAKRKNSNNGQYFGSPVDVGSLLVSRRKSVEKMIRHLSSLVDFVGRRVSTIFNLTGYYILFIDWSDQQGHIKIMCDKEAGRVATLAYCEHLYDRARRNEISENYCAKSQKIIAAFMTAFHGLDDLQSDIDFLAQNSRSGKGVQSPRQKLVQKHLQLTSCLFNGLSDLVLNNRDYPYQLKVPDYLAIKGNNLWVFPLRPWCMRTQQLSVRDRPVNYAYDYFSGEIRSYEYLIGLDILPGHAEYAIRNAEKNIANSNSDRRFWLRLQAAINAHNCFIELFIAITAIELTGLRQMTWNDEYRVSVTRQKFRSIKWRAGGKVSQFEIHLIFMPVFQRFLEVRKYLLDGKPYDLLFLSLGPNQKNSPDQVGEQILFNVLHLLRYIDPDLEGVNCQELRKFKAEWFLRNGDVSLTALILQNSEATTQRHYAAGSQVSAEKELTEFYSKVSEALPKWKAVLDAENKQTTAPAPLGECTDFQNPAPINADVPIAPDCKASEGCLFCDHFLVHAEDKDIRKIFSFLFYVRNISRSSIDDETYRPLTERIEQIVEEMRQSGLGESILRIEAEVNQRGRLDQYWEKKLQMQIYLEE